MQEKRKASISVILVMVFVLGLFIPMSQHARAAIPVPHNQYGHALDIGGVNFNQGEFMSAWIDGVMYGWNWTFDDILDPEYPLSNYSSKIDIDTVGNQVTIPGDPDTPWVKEGGDHNIDDIMYVWGDMTEYVVNLGSASTIFEQTVVWTTFDFFYSNLTIAPTQPSALPKINNIVTLPEDAGTQYTYIFGPQGTSMDEFYLEKNDGELHNVATQIFLSGTISETMYFYVDLGATDYLDIMGDELKLVWENPGGPGTPFGGMDVVVDRIEYNATAGGTHFGEPDNTIMPDANPPGPNFDIHRQPMPGDDTNDCSADFISGPEPGRPPAAPYPLSVDGVQATGPGQTISHVTNRVDPLLGWTHSDPDIPPPPNTQWGYRLEIATDPAFAAVIWSSYQPGSTASTEVYSGSVFSAGVCYYYRAKTKDGYDYGPWADTEICMNTPPPVPTNIWPANETIDPVGVVISWSIVTDAEGDPITYEVQADDEILFNPPYEFYPTATSDNFSIPHLYPALTQFWYRVRAHDGYEYSPWSNESGYWWFITTNPPIEPEAQGLSVEGFLLGSPDANHLWNRVNPVFSWTFTDANGDSQQAYNMEIRDAPGGMGSLIWGDSGGTSEQVTYADSQLAECVDYWFRVEVQDDSASQLWSLAWAEGSFHSNCIPTVPVLVNPPDGSQQSENLAQIVNWVSSSDDDLDAIDYEWSVEETCPPGAPSIISSGTTSVTSSDTFVTTAGCFYNWTVRAGDSWEWSAWAATFMFYIPIPNQRPTAATNLAVDGFSAGSQQILHLLNDLPTFSWTFNDPDPSDTQGARHLAVYAGPGATGAQMWNSNLTLSGESETYPVAGEDLLPCSTYYFRVLTADNNGWWAATESWEEIEFHMNCVPDDPIPWSPADGSVLAPSATQRTYWSNSTDGDDATVYYTIQVATNVGMNPPYVVDNVVTDWFSPEFQTTSGDCYYWRVNATDGWESTAWSNILDFCVNTPPDLPTDLMVERFTVADIDERMHIMVSQPTFNWTFTDPDGDSQAEYAVEVWTEPDGSGDPMWSASDTTSANETTYAGTTLVEGESYYFRVNASDGLEWSGWSELAFNMSAPPPAPQLEDPANNAVDVSTTPLLNWSGVVDLNGDAITYYWYLDNETTVTAPFLQEGTTTDTEVSITTALTESTGYHWKVCADDGWEQPECSVIWSFTTAAPSNLAPTAVATADRTTAEEGQTINFDGTGSTDPDGDTLTYAWTFDDGGTSTLAEPSHSYSTEGTYTVTLTVTDPGALSHSASLTITVTEKAEDDFFGTYWWVILLIIIIVIFVIILLAKRKKPEEEEESLAEEEEEAPPPDEEAEEAPEEEAEEKGAADMKECANCGTVLAADDTECFMCGAKV